MSPVYITASNVTAPIGLSTAEAWASVRQGARSVGVFDDPQLHPHPVCAARFDAAQWKTIAAGTPHAELSKFEQLALFSAKDALQSAGMASVNERTAFLLSTTKGNIEWLNERPDERNRLSESSRRISAALGIVTKPVVVSHACVSGVSGIIQAARLIRAGLFDTVIVTGADRLTPFVISGFASFQAMSDTPSRPFDAARNGINLGEAAATVVLSSTPGIAPLAQILGGATSNDANHISGPSRTGEELAIAVRNAIAESGLQASDIAAISAHGTATIYNDEMESKAFELLGLSGAPLHSLKGYTGHTLGAAGVLETALLAESMRAGATIASVGFENNGVPGKVNVSRESEQREIPFALKTASGFGGCNAALVLGGVAG
jgi:3-oxoacyl-[acyl-carrier-protein] synthase-1